MAFDGWYHRCSTDSDEERAVYGGSRCEKCGLSEGDVALRSTPDAEILAECTRRGFDRQFLSDDELRAACARRQMAMVSTGYLSDLQKAVRTQADPLARDQSVDGDYIKTGIRIATEALTRDRDEWKRRAEAAEKDALQHWNSFCASEEARTTAAQILERKVGSWRESLDQRDDAYGALTGTKPTTSTARLQESGPGIVNLTTGVATVTFLDEDLLCEDA